MFNGQHRLHVIWPTQQLSPCTNIDNDKTIYYQDKYGKQNLF